MKIKISVPATSANIGPGYDIWGMSIDLRNEFIVHPDTRSKEHHLGITPSPLLTKTSTSNYQSEIGNPDNNLFIKSYEKLFSESGLDIIYIDAEVFLNIPLSRGLGSSSTAIVGGLIAANEVIRKTHGHFYSIHELFQFAVNIEGHPDNVAPALYGGWILNIKDEKTGLYTPVNMEVKAPVRLAGIIPHISLSTEEARKVVPQTAPLNITTFQSTRTALMTHLLSKETWNDHDKFLFGLSIEDRVHQPMRSVLIPGMMKSFTLWQSQGALGSYLSGAGTTLLSFWNKDQNFKNIDFRAALLNNGIESTVFFPEFDNLGTTIENF
ncbi:MAG: homoserine kinase [Spirochaetia bacterium]|nr:homoserine kinase [Spirochaetia bacterium]